MSPRDQNDRYRDGDLPPDPTDGTEPYAAPDEEMPWGWRTIAELLAEPDDGTVYLWPGFVARRVLTLFAAAPKAGKTWTILAWIASLGRRGSWLGNPAVDRRIRVLLVTEEPAFLVKEHARRFGLDNLDILTIDRIPPGAKWPDVVENAVSRAREVGAEVVVFDTLSTLANILDENDAAQANGALRPLLHAARANDLAILVVHHARKGDGLDGEGIRGSSAFAAVPDVLVAVRREGGAGSRRRSLHVLSRLPGAPYGQVVVEYLPPHDGEPAAYRLVAGSVEVDPVAVRAAAKIERADAAILECLEGAGKKGDAAWLTRRQIIELIGRRNDVEARLPVLVKEGRVAIDTRGIGRGGAYLYAAVGTPLRVASVKPAPKRKDGEA